MLDTRAEHETKFLPSILTSRRDELFPRVAAYVRDVPVGTIEACHDGARRDPAGPAQHHTSRCRVPMALIESHGAVSEEVARAMADGALGRSDAAIAVSVTGMAGPGGGSAEQPVGLVYFGLARTGQPAISERHVFPGDRAAIRAATVAYALKMIRDAL